MPEIYVPTLPDRIIADEEIAASEFDRSLTHWSSDTGWPELNIAGARLLGDPQAEWYTADPSDVKTDMLIDNPYARTATLALVRMYREWDRARNVERVIRGKRHNRLRHEPHSAELFDRNSPQAERMILLEWGTVGVESLVKVMRRRRLLRTQPVQHQYNTTTGETITADAVIDVDKISTFSLNIAKLDEIDSEAAREIRLIIICGILSGANLGVVNPYLARATSRSVKDLADIAPFQLAKAKMQQYGIDPEEVMFRAYGAGASDKPEQRLFQLQSERSIVAIEREIKEHHGLLEPSTTTYYGERKLKVAEP